MSNWDPEVDVSFRQKCIWLAVFFAPFPVGVTCMLLEGYLGQSFGRLSWQFFLTSLVVSPVLCLGAIAFIDTHIGNKWALILFLVIAVAAHYALLVVLLATLTVFFDPLNGMD